MAKSQKKRGGCCSCFGCSLPVCLLYVFVLGAAIIVVTVMLYLMAFKQESPAPLASCNNCYCIVSASANNSTEEGGNGTCPLENKPVVDYSVDVINAFDKQRPNNASIVYGIACDPFDDDGCGTNPAQDANLTALGDDAVCGLLYDAVSSDDCPSTYRLVSYANYTQAIDDGAVVTHVGACGVCSSTQDLAALLQIQDIVFASKDCSKLSALSSQRGLDCFQRELGLTEHCATLWVYSAQKISLSCSLECGEADLLSDRYFSEDETCSLNSCLQCYQNKAAETFDRIAGRTSRRSGLLTSIARPCDSIPQLSQDPCPVAAEAL